MNHWVRDDSSYDQSTGLTDYIRRPGVRWALLFLAWVLVTAVLSAAHLAVLIWVIMAGLIWYVISYILRVTPSARQPRSSRLIAEDEEPRFNAPPGWPEPPPGWSPPPGWQPDPAWPPAPPGWRFWVAPTPHRTGARYGRDRYNGADGARHRNRW